MPESGAIEFRRPLSRRSDRSFRTHSRGNAVNLIQWILGVVVIAFGVLMGVGVDPLSAAVSSVFCAGLAFVVASFASADGDTVKSPVQSRTNLAYMLLGILFSASKWFEWGIESYLGLVAIGIGPVLRQITSTPVTFSKALQGLTAMEYAAAVALPGLKPAPAVVVRILAANREQTMTVQALERALDGAMNTSAVYLAISAAESAGMVIRKRTPSLDVVSLTEDGRAAVGLPLDSGTQQLQAVGSRSSG